MESGIITAYWVCLTIGVVYAVIALILGDLAGHDGDIGGVHGDIGHDVGGAGHAGDGGIDGGGGQLVFGPFSPLVIAFFLTSFGGTGLLVTRVIHPVSMLVALLLALASGFILAWLLVTGLNKLLGSLQSSSEVRMASLLGSEAEVTTQIPPDGVGEIAYVAMGARYVGPARSDEMVAIPRFSTVRIDRIVGSLFYVRLAFEEKVREMQQQQVDTALSSDADVLQDTSMKQTE
ncbi:MAG: hypothetical protein ACYDBB_01750 [Armatimonadota bacterium]